MQTGKAVADLKPLHPASSKIGDVVDNWYCRECCASFEQEGTYTCTEDQEALHVVERSLVMFQESTLRAQINTDHGGDHGVYSGTVTAYDDVSRSYAVAYNDGDCEDL